MTPLSPPICMWEPIFGKENRDDMRRIVLPAYQSGYLNCLVSVALCAETVTCTGSTSGTSRQTFEKSRSSGCCDPVGDRQVRGAWAGGNLSACHHRCFLDLGGYRAFRILRRRGGDGWRLHGALCRRQRCRQQRWTGSRWEGADAWRRLGDRGGVRDRRSVDCRWRRRCHNFEGYHSSFSGNDGD